MNARQPDGSTLRDHLQAVARSTGKTPDDLRQTPVPVVAAGVWNAFVTLADAARSAGFGPAPISFSDLAAWQQVNGVCLSPWEAETIIELDRASRAALSKDTA